MREIGREIDRERERETRRMGEMQARRQQEGAALERKGIDRDQDKTERST